MVIKLLQHCMKVPVVLHSHEHFPPLFHFNHSSEYVANTINMEVQSVSKSLTTKDQVMRKGSSH